MLNLDAHAQHSKRELRKNDGQGWPWEPSPPGIHASELLKGKSKTEIGKRRSDLRFTFRSPLSHSPSWRLLHAHVSAYARPMIEVPGPIVGQIQDQVFATYPAECCGLLFSKPDSDAVTR